MYSYKIDEFVHKTCIYEVAESLLNVLGVPCALVFRNDDGAIHVLEASRPFVDAFDFTLDEP